MKRAAVRCASLSLAAFGVLGCTFEDGKGFATLESATLSARMEVRGARKVDERSVSTDLDYVVALDSLVVRAVKVELRRSVEVPGGAAATFDPADPPAGYSLCHNGHCHHSSGRLVPYAEIEAELAGGAKPVLVPVVEAPGGDLDVLSRAERELEPIEPSRELPRATITEVGVVVDRLDLVGEVSGGPSDLVATPLELSTPLGGDLVRAAEVSVVDDDGPESLALDVQILVHDLLFDGVDFAAHVGGGAITVADADHPVAVDIAASFSQSALRVDLD